MSKKNKLNGVSSDDFEVNGDKIKEILFGKDVGFLNLDEDISYFSSGSFLIDSLLGRGWARGRIYLLKGRESVSKSRLMAGVCFVETRIFKNYVLVIDFEGTWTKDWLVSLNVDIDKVYIVHPDVAEESFDIAEKSIRSGLISTIIIDSIASMTTREEAEKSHEESTQAVLARQLSKFCRKAVGSLNKIKYDRFKNPKLVLPTVFLVNQVRTNLHNKYNPEILPGGQAQKNTASVILDLYRVGYIENEESENVGFYVNARTDKNKLGVPFRSVQFGLITAESGYLGHPQHALFLGYEIFLLGKNYGIIKQSGSWYEIIGYPKSDKKIQGEKEVIWEITKNDDLAMFLINEIKKKLKEEIKSDVEFNFDIFKKSLEVGSF